MFTVYILADGVTGKLYKGCTNDIVRRLREHRSGSTITTSKMKDLQLVYQEQFSEFKEARERELYFKTAAGRRFIQKILGP